MGRRILITGGAGFIGSHLADELLAAGHRVRALDSPAEQAAHRVINSGAGRSRTILEVAERITRALGKEHIQREVTGLVSRLEGPQAQDRVAEANAELAARGLAA